MSKSIPNYYCASDDFSSGKPSQSVRFLWLLLKRKKVISLRVIQSVAHKVPLRNWLMAVWTRICWRCELPISE